MCMIIDNFLDDETFSKLQNSLLGKTIPWYFYDYTTHFARESAEFFFGHTFYESYMPRSAHSEELKPLIDKIHPISVWKVRANLLTRTPTIVESAYHTDMGSTIKDPEKLKQWTTAIFYINTNDGYTKLEDGTIVESVANRLLTFPANVEHKGTTCTDEKRRVVLNLNYFS